MLQAAVSLPLSNRTRTPRAGVGGGFAPAANEFWGDEFWIGPENRLLAQAVRSVFERQVTRVSPLVLVGPGGSGKSHVARGLAAWWMREHRSARIVIQAGSEFAHDYAAAVDRDRLSAWRHELHAADVLVLDNLHELVGKRGAQQELRFALDELSQRQALVVIVSTVPPQQLVELSESLRSRLDAGLNVPINLPSPPVRRMLVEQFAAAHGFNIPQPTLRLLADGLSAPAPVLLAALTELELVGQREGVVVDAPLVRKVMAERDARPRISLREIGVATAKYFGLKLADLKSPSRRKAIVSARGVAVYLARQMTDHSLEQIGSYLGGRDHTTILHGFRRTEELARTDSATRQALADIRRQLT